MTAYATAPVLILPFYISHSPPLCPVWWWANEYHMPISLNYRYRVLASNGLSRQTRNPIPATVHTGFTKHPDRWTCVLLKLLHWEYRYSRLEGLHVRRGVRSDSWRRCADHLGTVRESVLRHAVRVWMHDFFFFSKYSSNLHTKDKPSFVTSLNSAHFEHFTSFSALRSHNSLHIGWRLQTPTHR